jgi:hypothetical protein
MSAVMELDVIEMPENAPEKPGDPMKREPTKSANFIAKGHPAVDVLLGAEGVSVEKTELLNELLNRYGWAVLEEIVEKRKRKEKAILHMRRGKPNAGGKGP